MALVAVQKWHFNAPENWRWYGAAMALVAAPKMAAEQRQRKRDGGGRGQSVGPYHELETFIASMSSLLASSFRRILQVLISFIKIVPKYYMIVEVIKGFGTIGMNYSFVTIYCHKSLFLY
uniref:Uncharacterized protein n=1 Tax=Vitis vinifera TaxID=29760 RepID=A5C1T5_VITVI|nr:hypothetical protein VITISV_015780 [Vitis vinifera]